METIAICPICSGTVFQPFISCLDYTVSRETFNIIQCNSCGFKLTSPRPDENEIGRYYESDEYISHSGTAKGIVNKIYGIVRKYTIQQKARLINAQIRTPHSMPRALLDIGCGTGEFISACKQNGWTVTGIEPSEVARKKANEKHNIHPLKPEQLFKLNEKKFDVITMWHVLEHVHQLNRTILQIGKILSDNGILVIAVPNCNSWDAGKYKSKWAAYDLPRHLYHFTQKDIIALFSKHGFELRKVLPMKFDSFYVSMLSEKYATGKLSMMYGFLNGLLSNLFAGNATKGHSSQIYILKQKTH